MTQLSQTQRRNPALALAGVAIAASLLGGIVGGVAGTRVQAMVEGAQAAQAADAARVAAAEQAKWNAYGAEWERLHRAQANPALSTHDQAVLKQAQEWEARYRQMYPAK